MKNLVLGIRLTTNSKFGSGHISRCLTLINKKEEVIFFTDPNYKIKGFTSIEEKSLNSLNKSYSYLKKKKISLLIVDNYHINKEILEKISKNNIVFVLDDYNHKWRNPYVIRPNLKQLKVKDKRILQGPDYALISSEYCKNKTRFQKSIRKQSLKNILINMGTNDTKNNNTKILNQIEKLNLKINKITIILRKSAPHYKEVLSFKKKFKNFKLISIQDEKSFIDQYCKHNYFIGCPGVSSLERISLSVYSLNFIVNTNQNINGKEIKLNDYGLLGGNINNMSDKNLKLVLKKYLLDKKYFNRTIKKDIVDGNGVKRIWKILAKL